MVEKGEKKGKETSSKTARLIHVAEATLIS